MLGNQIKDNFTYYPHQIETIKRLVKNSRQVISFGTGTGKSMTFIGGFAACRKLGFGTRAIIICDKSSVVSIVADVEEKTNLTYFFFDEKQAVIPNDCDLLLITYNRADQVLSQIDVKQFSHLIFDEAHKLKNEESGVSKDLSFYRDQFKYIWFSSATLMSNSIQDLHGMFSWLVPELFPNWWEFRKQYCILKKRNVKMFRRGKTGKQYQVRKEIEEIVGYQNLELLKEKIEPYVCYYTKDHEIEFHEIQVVLNEDEKEHYLAASKGFDERKLRDDDIVPHSVRLHDLQLTIDNGREGNTSKQKVLSDYLHTNQMFGSIVYFSYKESLQQVYQRFQKQFEIEIITGEVSSSDRKRIKQWLQPGRFLFMTDAGGQCFARGTKVLMYDGSIKEIQDIVVGDSVMGPDSCLREVESVHSGIDNLYKVKSFRGDTYVVSKKSILSFVRSGESKLADTVVDLSVEEYFKKTEYERGLFRRWKVLVDFPERDLKIPPYILGLWLGDGCRWGSTLYVRDGEFSIVKAWCDYGMSLGLQIKIRPQSGCSKITLTTGVVGRPTHNKLILDLREYNLIKNKHIPSEYMSCSLEQRLELIAGIIDTDGYLHNKVGYEVVTNSEKFAQEFKRLVNSVGLSISISSSIRSYAKDQPGKLRYRISISGDCTIIPVRLSNKKSVLNRIGRSLLYKCKVSFFGRGKHFGFSLKGRDSHFLLEDCTVVHNSLNLDSVDRLVFYDIPFSIVTVSQAIGRIVRMSSPYKKFHVFFLNTKDTIDSYKYNLVSTHAELIKWILGGYKNLPDMKYHSPEHMRTLRKSLLWKK